MGDVKFAHLHVHTDGSLMDGLGSVQRLVDAASRLGFEALAMTDHGNLSNAVAFHLACERVGIKPIIGMEAYVRYGDDIGHLTLLADGNEGFDNLIKLNNLGVQSTARQPAFTVEQLIENNDGLLLLTGCSSSPLQKLPLDEALYLAVQLKHAFKKRMFAEMMFVSEGRAHQDRAMELISALNLRPVVTNDVHFPYMSDADIHPILVQMKAGYSYDSSELWLKDWDAIALYGDVDVTGTVFEGMRNAAAIARKIKVVNLKRSAIDVLPKPKGAHSALVDIVHRRAAGCDEKTASRLHYELEIIKDMGYAGYFLILNDLVAEAKNLGVRVGPGRGSGAGSLVLFYLGVTDIDPLEYGLSFDRFLNRHRKGMPDVDVDFDSERRGRLIEYAARKYGAKQIATYSRYSQKSLVHDLSTQLRIPRDDEARLKLVDDDGDEFASIGERYPPFLEAYDAFKGQIRHRGRHAGGVVIAKDGVNVPLVRTGDSYSVAWVEGKTNELSHAGFVKFDLLGLSALAVLRRLEEEFGFRAPAPNDVDKKSPMWDLFSRGLTAGIFQFSGSQGIKDMVMKMKPKSIHDLIAANALYRPGPLDVGTTSLYVKIMAGEDEPRKLHPSIDPILEETYGVIVYQEQVMKIIAKILGGTEAEADLARRIIFKTKTHDPEWVKAITDLKNQFIYCAIEHGVTRSLSVQLWSELSSHARYSFNKAHSAAYGFVAYEMAWWKATHTAAFFAAMLNVDPSNAQEYIFEAVNMDVLIEAPTINFSGVEYTYHENSIYIPFQQIKYMGEAGAKALVEARGSEPFLSTADFMSRVPKKHVRARARLGLVALGSFVDIDFEIDDLQLTSTDVPPNVNDRQHKFLGFVIPSLVLFEIIESNKEIGWECGIISRKKRKTSKYGPYIVYYLAPSGVFWTRHMEEFDEGQLVRAKVKPENGKAMKVERL